MDRSIGLAPSPVADESRRKAPETAGSRPEIPPAPVIRIGWRLRLGVIQASVNTIAEPQMQAMLPDGVSMHTTRLSLVGSSEEELLGMADRLEEAATLLADADSDRILFHCTATTTYDPEMPDRLRERIAAVTGIPATTTSEAIVAALHAFGARKVVLVTPYIHPINEREVAFLGHNGIAVLREHGLELPGGRAFRQVEPGEWYRTVMANRDDGADAYFISCANVRAAEIIETLERDLGRPVVTSNQAGIWRCLRQCGIDDPVAGFGALLRM